MKISPPKFAQKILTSFLKEDLVEEVLGDLDEKFQQLSASGFHRKAKLNYWYQVFHYIRPFAIKRLSSLHINRYDMFKNYFVVGLRSLLKQKMYSFIKIGGFALGIAACILISLYIKDELSFDRHYTDGDRIFRVYLFYKHDGEISKAVWFQAPFARTIKEEFPEIEEVGRYNSTELFGAGGVEIRRADRIENTYEEGYVFADQEMLDILNVNVVYGSPEHLLDEPGTIVLTKSKADKYFPGQDPVGQLIVINDDEDNPLKIGGVIEDFPKHSHLDFKFIRTLKNHEFWEGEQNNWGATNYPTYVKLKAGANPEELAKKMQVISEKYMLPLLLEWKRPNAHEMIKNSGYGLQPIKDIHLRSAGIDDPLSHGDIRFVYLFGVVAFFILIIACINFINLSTAKSANRAKEVGLRKTVGSYRSNIINQFLTESLMYSFVSFTVGLLLAWTLLPYFNLLASKSIEFPWTEWWLVPVFIATALTVGLIAGIYPAFYLSSFLPVQVLKGNVSRGSKNGVVRSTLVVFQFTASIVLIICTFVIYKQVQYILNKKVGFDKDQVVMLHGTATMGDHAKVFKEELTRLSVVKNVTISDYLPVQGTKRNGNSFLREGDEGIKPSVGGQAWVIDQDYLPTLGMKLVEGRNFSKDIASDTAATIINQKMAHDLGLTNPIVGQRIRNWRTWTIIGVVEDFHFSSMREPIEPLCLTYGLSPGIISVKLAGKDMSSSLKLVEGVWKKFSPHQPIRYSFMDENFARMYDDVKRMGQIFTSFAILAIVVACLGLFALSAFMVEQRGKEISIRIVLGASLRSIFNLLTYNFVKLVVASLLIAAPLAWYLMNKWLEDFEYKTEISWEIFAIAGALSVMIALVTISYQAIHAALANPVKNLRSE